MVHLSHALRHGDVQIGEPRDPALRFSSPHVHHFVYPAIPPLGAGLGFRRGRQGSPNVSAISLERGTGSLLQ